MEQEQLNPDLAAAADEHETEKHLRLRARILKTLYVFFQEHPYATMDLPQLMEICESEVKPLNWNLVYLERCGFVELGKLIDSPPYIACSATITETGIDLIENPSAFCGKFYRDTAMS